MRRRLPVTGIFLVTAAIAAWACGDDYTEGPPASGDDDDAGIVDAMPGKDSQPVLEAAIVVIKPEIKLGTIEPIPRGEGATLPITIVRGSHQGPLTLAVSGLPAGVSAPSVAIDPPATTGSLTLTASDKAPEGSLSIDLALLDGTEKIATASIVVQIAPFRPGTLDPDFGNNGVVDLDVPQSLLAFAGDGTLYVNAPPPTNLARWSKDGVRDATYGGVSRSPTQEFWHMAVTDSGLVHFSGYELVNNGTASVPILVRIFSDGKNYDTAFGNGGVSVVPTSGGGKFHNAFRLILLPTSIYAVVKHETEIATGKPGVMEIARVFPIGTPDTSFGTGGVRVLPHDINAEQLALSDAIGVDQYLLATGHLNDAGAPSYHVLEGSITADTTRLLEDGVPTALAFGPKGSFVARSADAGVGIIRVGDGGVDPSFGGANGVVAAGPVKALSVDKEGRPLASTCRETAATWTRYLPDGGADPTYRNGSSTEIKCVLAMRTTDKFVYLAGIGGPLNRLRMARLLR